MLRTVLLLSLVTSSTALGQLREGGKYSIRNDQITAIALDSTSKFALLAFQSGGVVVFPVDQSNVMLYSFPAQKKGVTAAVFLPDGKSFVTAGTDGTIRIWDVLAARKHHQEMEQKLGESKAAPPKAEMNLTAFKGSPVTALAISPDGKRIVAGCLEGTVRIWEVENGKLVTSLPAVHPGGVKSIAFRPDGKEFATGGADKSAKTWNFGEKISQVKVFEDHPGAVTCVAYSPDGKHLAAGTGNPKKSGTIKVWDTEFGKLAYTLEGHEDMVTCVLFHPKAAQLASGGADHKVRIWDLKSKKEVAADDHPDTPRGLIVSTDGTRFATITPTLGRWWYGFGSVMAK